MKTFQVRIVYQPMPIPEAPEIEAEMPGETEQEVVVVVANDLRQATKRAMLHATIEARGRLVRYFDEAGREVFNH